MVNWTPKKSFLLISTLLNTDTGKATNRDLSKLPLIEIEWINWKTFLRMWDLLYFCRNFVLGEEECDQILVSKKNPDQGS